MKRSNKGDPLGIMATLEAIHDEHQTKLKQSTKPLELVKYEIKNAKGAVTSFGFADRTFLERRVAGMEGSTLHVKGIHTFKAKKS